MDESESVALDQTIHQIVKQSFSIFVAQKPFLVDEVEQVASLRQLHDDVHVILRLQDLHQLDDVLVTKTAQRVQLSREKLEVDVLGDLPADDLHSHWVLQPQRVSILHLTVGPRAQRLAQNVPASVQDTLESHGGRRGRGWRGSLAAAGRTRSRGGGGGCSSTASIAGRHGYSVASGEARTRTCMVSESVSVHCIIMREPRIDATLSSRDPRRCCACAAALAGRVCARRGKQ